VSWQRDTQRQRSATGCGAKRMGTRTCTTWDERLSDSAPDSVGGHARHVADSCSGMTWGWRGPGRRRPGSAPGRSTDQRHQAGKTEASTAATCRRCPKRRRRWCSARIQARLDELRSAAWTLQTRGRRTVQSRRGSLSPRARRWEEAAWLSAHGTAARWENGTDRSALVEGTVADKWATTNSFP
jgi:hypothetical protein